MSWFDDFVATAKSKVAQFNNANFKNAAMAVCALIAAADGTIDASEKKKVAALISKNEMLSVFSGAELGQLFNGFCDKATDDFSRLDLLNLVRKLKGHDDQADTALRVALVIANADGVFSDDEKKVVSELCQVLGLASSAYVT